MKITISNTLITGISANIANIALHIQALRETHPFLKKEAEKDIQEYLKHNKVSIEEAQELKSFKFPTESLLSAIKEKTVKLGSLIKTADGIELEIKDDFILESVMLSTNLMIKTLKPVADIMGIFEDHKIHVEQFNERWDEKPEEIVPNENKESEITTKEWIVKEAKHGSRDTVLMSNSEDFIITSDLECTNSNNQTIDVYTHTIRTIIESEKSLEETAKRVSLPASLVNTLRENYNLPLLVSSVKESSSEVKEIILSSEDTKTTDEVENIQTN